MPPVTVASPYQKGRAWHTQRKEGEKMIVRYGKGLKLTATGKKTVTDVEYYLLPYDYAVKADDVPDPFLRVYDITQGYARRTDAIINVKTGQEFICR